MSGWLIGRTRGRVVAGIWLAFLAACPAQEAAPELPGPEAAAARYGAGAEAELAGNVLEVRIEVPDELLRGGPLWARSGPYFYLFSAATRDLFVENPGLAAVRVVTRTGEGTEIARAMLRRDALSVYEWEEALRVRSLAQAEGTERPSRVDRLVRWGEDRTEHTYNPRFIGR